MASKRTFRCILTAMFTWLVQKMTYPLLGLKLVWREEISFKIQVACALVAGILGLYLRIPPLEFAVVILAISCVLAAEAFNTALEEFCDKFQPDHDPHIARIKDLSASAVLLVSIGAFVVGLIIFLPYL